MTLTTALVWSISRSLLLPTLALYPAFGAMNLLAFLKQRRRTQILVAFLMLLPLLIPDLLIGFTYQLTAARLAHHVSVSELLYAGLLLIKVTSLQVAALMILRHSSVSPESLHAWKMLSANQQRSRFHDRRTLLVLWVNGPLRPVIIGWAISALYCFQEFETAALIQLNRHPVSWTVWLFDAHADNESLTKSLLLASRAMLFQVLLLAPFFVLLNAGADRSQTSSTRAALWNRFGKKTTSIIPGILFTALAVWTFVLWPKLCHSSAALNGLAVLSQRGSLFPSLQQILWSLLAAVIAAGLSLGLGVVLHRMKQKRLTWTVLLPGLSGPLILSLVLLQLFQLPGINVAYDTWLPMILGGMLLLGPRAWLLIHLLNVTAPPSTIHSAQLLKRSTFFGIVKQAQWVLWRLRTVRWLIALAILTHWCFWDVTIYSILRPVSFEAVVTRLYNEMHWAASETMLAMTTLSLLVPVLLFLVAGSVSTALPLIRGRWRQRKFAPSGVNS
ncbi:MAG: hypothetical protein KDA81_14065 [Planctomycetaceae bacterium]|nr:hypothetical protein [Planctomycetaceae bacterium]